MPRVAVTQPGAPKRATARAPARNPRLIAERPSKYEIRRRHLAKYIGPLTLLAGVTGLALVILMLSSSMDPASFSGRMREKLGAVSGMDITQVVYLNRKHTPQSWLDDAIGIGPDSKIIGTPIFNYPLDLARRRLLEIPWIAQATVERRLPSTIVIDLTEHDAFAIWQYQGKFVLIDRNGRPLPDVDVANFKQLPLVVGEGAPAAAPDLIAALAAQPAIQKLVTAAVWVGNRRWDLYLSNQTEVLLPQNEASAALARLTQFEARDKLFERPLAAIDLRQSDKLVIRLRAAPAPVLPAATPAIAVEPNAAPAKEAP